MNRRGRQIILLSILFVFFGGAMSARAEAEKKEESSSERVSEAFKWVNFAIVAGGVVWLFGKVLPATFRKRAEGINSAISTATAAKNEADRQLKEASVKLARLDQEVAELRVAAQSEAAAEGQRIRAATQKEAEKIAAASQAEIEAAERAARLELKALGARLAVDGAESLLARQLTPKVQESLVQSFVQSLAGRPN